MDYIAEVKARQRTARVERETRELEQQNRQVLLCAAFRPLVEVIDAFRSVELRAEFDTFRGRSPRFESLVRAPTSTSFALAPIDGADSNLVFSACLDSAGTPAVSVSDAGVLTPETALKRLLDYVAAVVVDLDRPRQFPTPPELCRL
jgi:hypothetical protein